MELDRLKLGFTEKTDEEVEAALEEIKKVCIDVFYRKNHDYKNSAHKSFIKFGHVALIIRINDKLERIAGLASKGAKSQVLDESMADTILDAFNYTIMLLGEMRWLWNLGRKPMMQDEEQIDNTYFIVEAYDDVKNPFRRDSIDDASLQSLLDTTYGMCEYLESIPPTHTSRTKMYKENITLHLLTLAERLIGNYMMLTEIGKVML